MKARVVLYVFLATLFFAFFLIAQQLIVNFHPQIPAKSSASKEPLFQVKSAKDLEILDEQLYEFSAKAVEMKEVVLVTGGSGFICSHFVDLLLREGYQVFFCLFCFDFDFDFGLVWFWFFSLVFAHHPPQHRSLLWTVPFNQPWTDLVQTGG